jgi:hypothetical protein
MLAPECDCLRPIIYAWAEKRRFYALRVKKGRFFLHLMLATAKLGAVTTFIIAPVELADGDAAFSEQIFNEWSGTPGAW